MNLRYRLESAGRTRFLLALSLSTLTALGVAAPLALQATRADEPTFVAGRPTPQQPAAGSNDPVASDVAESRSLSGGETGSRGGIRPQEDSAKAGARSTKSDEAPSDPTQEPEKVLTNPNSTTTIPVPTTAAEATTATSETTAPAETTTTDPDATTSSSDTTDTSTTTTTEATTIPGSSSSSTSTSAQTETSSASAQG